MRPRPVVSCGCLGALRVVGVMKISYVVPAWSPDLNDLLIEFDKVSCGILARLSCEPSRLTIQVSRVTWQFE